MNIQPHQIDPTGSVDGERVIGYANGDELLRRLSEGNFCGGWSKKRKAYAVLRPAKKRGRKSIIPKEYEAEALQLCLRLIEIAESHGVAYRGLMKRLHQLRRQQL